MSRRIPLAVEVRGEIDMGLVVRAVSFCSRISMGESDRGLFPHRWFQACAGSTLGAAAQHQIAGGPGCHQVADTVPRGAVAIVQDRVAALAGDQRTRTHQQGR